MQSCLKPQNPCLNHEIHVLFDHFADAFVRNNVARVYMTLWRRNDVRKFDAGAILF